MSSLEEIKNKLEAYKSKYYQRQLLVGLLSFIILTLSTFLLLAFLEHNLWMSSVARTILFFLFLFTSLGSLYTLVIAPLLKYIKVRHGLKDEEAANEIAQFFPKIEDRLLNLLQLGNESVNNNQLIHAAIEKKALELKTLPFVKAVDFSVTKKYLLILGSVLFFFAIASFINPTMISESPKRIARYNEVFVRKAPFTFNLMNSEFRAFKGEDYTLNLEIEGGALPDEVFLINNNTKFILPGKEGKYEYTFERILNSQEIKFEASGFYSKKYLIEVVERPDLVSMNIFVTSPDYTGGARRVVTNTGDLTIMEGSIVRWEIDANSTEYGEIIFDSDTSALSRLNQDQFVLEKRIFNSSPYNISLRNEFTQNKSKLNYSIKTIEDQFPKVQAEFFPDSASYEYITLAGSISDDYGFSRLALNYRKNDSELFQTIPLEINNASTTQSFYANWSIDTLNLQAGNRLEVYISVKDNDQVNGAKTSKSKTFVLQIPTEEEIDELISEK